MSQLYCSLNGLSELQEHSKEFSSHSTCCSFYDLMLRGGLGLQSCTEAATVAVAGSCWMELVVGQFLDAVDSRHDRPATFQLGG